MSKNIILKPSQGQSTFSIDMKVFCEIINYTIKEDVVLYKIHLKSHLTNKEWQLMRRFSEFFDFYTILSRNFFNLPSIPKKTLTKVNSQQTLDSRKEQLNSFLRLIINRTDIMSNMATYHFLELKNHFPDFILFQPMILFELNDLSFEVNAVDYNEEGSLVFAGMGNKTNTNKVSKLFNKFSTFLSSVNNTIINNGRLVIYNMIQSKGKETMLHPIFENDYPCSVVCLKFFKENNFLSLGFENGEIKLLKIYITEKSNISKNLVDEVSSIKAHNSPIQSIEIDFTTGYIFSISNDFNLNISEYNYQTNIKSIQVSKEILTCLLYNQENQLLVITDCKGSLFFFNVSNPINPKRLQSIHGSFNSINYLNISNKNKLYLGTNNGELLIFNVTVSKEGLFMSQETTVYTDDSLKIIKVYESNEHYIVGLSNGSISIHRKTEHTYPYFVITFHQSQLGSYVYIEDKNIIISCSKDKSIKVYQLPIYYPSEMILSKFKEEPSSPLKLDSIDERLSFDVPKNSLEQTVEKIEKHIQKKTDKKHLTENEIICEDLNGWDMENKDFTDFNDE